MKNKKALSIIIIVLFVVIAGIIYTFESQIKHNSVSTTLEETSPPITSDRPLIQENQKIFVHICGEVKCPGVYEVNLNDRIIDVIDCAGGFTKKAAKDYENLAEKVTDGQKVYIPSKAEIESGNISNAAKDSNHTDSSKININTASKEELMTLTGVGESKAQSIIDYRDDFGPFAKTEDIMKIQGIKEGLYNKIKEFITIS